MSLLQSSIFSLFKGEIRSRNSSCKGRVKNIYNQIFYVNIAFDQKYERLIQKTRSF